MGLSQQIHSLMCERDDESTAHGHRNREARNGHYHRQGEDQRHRDEYQHPTQFMKMDFPRFSQVDVLGWIMPCKRYFELDGTPKEDKVKMASICLDKNAWSWHKSIEKMWFGVTPTWIEYAEALKERFGPTHKTPLGDLMHLRQKASLAEFNDVFDNIASKLDFSQEYLVEAYLGGLSEEYTSPIRLFKPRTLQKACFLARMQEITLQRQADKRTSVKNVAQVAAPPFASSQGSQNNWAT